MILVALFITSGYGRSLEKGLETPGVDGKLEQISSYFSKGILSLEKCALVVLL